MRMVHTADVHLDRCFAGDGLSPEDAGRRRARIRETFHAVLEGAASASALVIAGDLFDLEYVTDETAEFLREQFEAAAPLSIFIAPGNRDPYTNDSPYAARPWPANVIIFGAPAWKRHDLPGGLTVHGRAITRANTEEDPFADFSLPRDGRRHVAVLHATERSLQERVKNLCAPFSAESADLRGLSYVALGHHHAATEITGANTCAWYPGPPEALSFDETVDHVYLDVDLSEARPRVTPVPVGQVSVVTRVIDCASMGTLEELRQALREMASASSKRVAARVTLVGAVMPDFAAGAMTLADELAGDFECLDVEERFELKAPSPPQRPVTIRGRFEQRLRAEIRDTVDAPRVDMLKRARDVGLAAFLDAPWPIRGQAGAAP